MSPLGVAYGRAIVSNHDKLHLKAKSSEPHHSPVDFLFTVIANMLIAYLILTWAFPLFHISSLRDSLTFSASFAGLLSVISFPKYMFNGAYNRLFVLLIDNLNHFGVLIFMSAAIHYLS